MMNKKGIDAIDEIYERGLNALNADDFEAAANNTGALLLDVRSPEEFIAGFIPNSIFIGLDGPFAPWVGALITDLKQNILLITEPGREEETVKRLARVGYDHTIGYLEGGFETWKKSGKEIDAIDEVDVTEFEKILQTQPKVLDVRKPDEFENQHISR
jgi:hydroxyacylglutathione hydrolase